MLRADFSSKLSKPASFGVIEVQLLGRRRWGLFDKRPGLVERQGETIDFVGYPRGENPVGLESSLEGRLVRDEPPAAEQEERTLLRLHLLEFHEVCDAYCTVPGES